MRSGDDTARGTLGAIGGAAMLAVICGYLSWTILGGLLSEASGQDLRDGLATVARDRSDESYSYDRRRRGLDRVEDRATGWILIGGVGLGVVAVGAAGLGAWMGVSLLMGGADEADDAR